MGSKTSRRTSENEEVLSKESIDELCQDTGFTEEELLAWHTNFYRDCPDGKLTLKQFEHEYSKIMGKPTQKTSEYVKHMFHVYDQDNNQFIDFKEFVMALSAASVVNRLRLVETLFSVFDLDTDGKISKEEMGKMLHTLVDVTNSNRKHRPHHSKIQDDTKQTDLQKRLDDAFGELNSNDDDFITKDEFIDWYIKSGLLSDVQSNEIHAPQTSRIQQLNKKSRKLKKQQTNIQRKEDNSHSRAPPFRYMTHMIEQKTAPVVEDDQDDNYLDEQPVLAPTTVSDDNDSHYSKDNERWQHLFNSVLGQIRAQRPEEIGRNYGTNHNRITHFNSWKQQGEERLKSEYYRQKSTEPKTSLDIVTVRL